MKIKAMVNSIDVYELRQEDFIKEPKAQLRKLCLWLGVEPSLNYLDACASIVFDSPHKSRHKYRLESRFKAKDRKKN